MDISKKAVGQVTILLVDDDEVHRRVFANGLVNLGYDVVEAASGQEAIRLSETALLDLVLLDIHLQDMNGLDVLLTIRTRVSMIHLPVIMLTGSIDGKLIIDALQKGANDYIAKPTELPVALARIKTHVIIRQQELELENRRAHAIGSAKMLALGDLAAGIAHEINNPLAIICAKASQLSSIAMKLSSDQQAQILPGLEQIQKTGFRIAKIVDAIEKFSRLADKDPLEEVFVADFITDAVLLCNSKLRSGNVGLIIPETFPDVKILCRSTEMSQVIYSLLSNAYDAVMGLQERWVRIDFENTELELLISITDSGKGIPISIKNKMFQPFFTTKPIGKGTGLSLSKSLGVIHSYHGIIEVDQTSVNTRFVIRLPRIS